MVRPANQLLLSAAELEEEIGRELTTGNPAAPTSMVRYHAKERGYRAEPIIDQQLHHFVLGGCLMHCESEEAAREQQRQAGLAAAAPHAPRGTAQAQPGRGGQSAQPGQAVAAVHGGGAGGQVGPEAAVEPEASTSEAGEDETTVRLRNQFNFADRAAQTAHQRPKDRGTSTEPPPTASTSGSCSRPEIYEAYLQDQERQRQADAAARQKVQVARRGHPAAAAQKAAELALTTEVQVQPQPGAGLAGAACFAVRDSMPSLLP